MKITDEEYAKMQRQIAKLEALEYAGVDNWDGYNDALYEWHEENEIEEEIDEAVDVLNDILVNADVQHPAGVGCGYAIHYNTADVRKMLRGLIEYGRFLDDAGLPHDGNEPTLKWINT